MIENFDKIKNELERDIEKINWHSIVTKFHSISTNTLRIKFTKSKNSKTPYIKIFLSNYLMEKANWKMGDRIDVLIDPLNQYKILIIKRESNGYKITAEGSKARGVIKALWRTTSQIQLEHNYYPNYACKNEKIIFEIQP